MPDRTHLRKISHVAGILVMAASTIFFAHVLLRNINQVQWDAHLEWIVLGSLAAIVLYVSGMISNSVAWSGYLRIMGETISYRTGARIVLLSQFAKYLPGNVAHHLGRIMLAREAGSSTMNAAESTAVEIGITILTGSLIAVVGSAAYVDWLQATGHDTGTVSHFVLIAMIAILASCGVMGLMMILRRRQGVTTHGVVSRLRGLGVLLAASGIAFITASTSLWIVLWTVTGTAMNWPAILVIFATAWTLGVVTPGAPGGLGVREAIIVAGLAPSIGAGNAAAAALVFRVVTILGDGVGFLGGLSLSWRKRLSANGGDA